MRNLLDFFITRKEPKLQDKVSILIPVRGDSRYTTELCFKSIKRNTDYPNYQIIICDDGADEATRNYLLELAQKNEIKLIKSTNPGIPKDDLVKAVDTEYYIFMHDDIKILKRNWLTKRMLLMNQSKKNAIVGAVVKNFGSKKIKRFLPLGILVKTEISRKLGLVWGKQLDKGLDTGGPAYQRFFTQNEYKFVPCKPSKDIYHFSDMTWVQCKDKNFPDLDRLLKERQEKINLIRKILEKEFS